MRIRHLIVIAAALAVLVTESGAAPGSTQTAVKQQRIAIESKFSFSTSKGTFRLIPLTPGPLKPDSGTFAIGGQATPNPPGEILEKGQTVELITASERMTGKRGSFSIAVRLKSRSAGGGYTADVGSWSFEQGTRAYAGLIGGGGIAAVTLPNSQLRVRREGIVRAG
jgi:hypothetical protein